MWKWILIDKLFIPTRSVNWHPVTAAIPFILLGSQLSPPLHFIVPRGSVLKSRHLPVIIAAQPPFLVILAPPNFFVVNLLAKFRRRAPAAHQSFTRWCLFLRCLYFSKSALDLAMYLEIEDFLATLHWLKPFVLVDPFFFKTFTGRTRPFLL